MWAASGVMPHGAPEELLDALFLAAHPGWTYPALDETPEEVLALLTLAESAIAERRKREAAS